MRGNLGAAKLKSDLVETVRVWAILTYFPHSQENLVAWLLCDTHLTL